MAHFENTGIRCRHSEVRARSTGIRKQGVVDLYGGSDTLCADFLPYIFGTLVVGCFLRAAGTVHELLHTIPVHPVFSFLPASLHSGGGGGGRKEGRTFLLPSVAPTALHLLPSPLVSFCPNIVGSTIAVSYHTGSLYFLLPSFPPSSPSETVNRQHSYHSYSTVSPRAPT